MKLLGHLLWGAIAAAAAFCLGGVALIRGEHINSIWLVLAAACTYLTATASMAEFIAARVMALDDQRATPAERLRNGHDFEPTNKWIVFGHHFAAIAGPGPLVGPVLAAQFGYLPGTLWIIIGAVLGGAVQDFVILFASMRRDGKSLGQMAREEIGKVGGFVALRHRADHHGDSAGGGRAGGGQRAGGQPVGHVHHRGHHAHRAVHGAATCATGAPGKVLECSAIGFAAGAGRHLRRAAGSASRRTGAGVHAVAPWRSPSSSSSTDFWPARCRSGCCSRRAII